MARFSLCSGQDRPKKAISCICGNASGAGCRLAAILKRIMDIQNE